MNRFSSLVPGRWSSHPKALKWQRKVFVFVAILPLAATLALGCWLFVDCGGWEKLLHPISASFTSELIWLKLAVGLACATGAAYVAFTLLHGLAMVGDNGEGDDLPFPVWMLVLTALLWLVPIAFYAIRHFFLPPGRFVVLNIVLNGICLLPVASIVAWIKLHEKGGKKEKRRRTAKPWAPLLAAIVCTLAALGALSPDCPCRLIWGCAWGCVAFLLWAKLVFDWLKSWRKTAAAEEKDDSSNPPGWVEKIRARLPDGIVLGEDVHRTEVPDAARFDPSPDPVLLLFMDEKTPTVDQSAFFRRFRDVRDEAWRRLYDENRSVIGAVSCDLLLTGVEGAGRTEIMLASALYAAVVRGECVLYITASLDRARAFKEKVDSRIRKMMLGDYLNTEVLTHSVMNGLLWRGDGVAMPGILFATPEQVEENFFADSIGVDSGSVANVHEMMLLYGTVFVDDYCEHSQDVRIHLAFLLDKWRLVLANGFVIPQFVVALSPICRPEGVQELGRRLFGVQGFSVDNDIVVLRPRETEPYWVGTIRIPADQDVDRAVTEILGLCLAEHLRVVYYSRGMSGREKASILKGLAAGDDLIRLLSHLDEITEEDASADAVLHLSLTSGNASAAMRLRTGDTPAVFLWIVSDAEVEALPVSERLIPLPDETALSIKIYHLKSVLKFIPPKTPVDAAVWSRFGISMTADLLRDGRRMDDESVPARWFYDSWTEKSYPRVAPYLVLENAVGISTNGYHIDSGVLPSPDEVLWKEDFGVGRSYLLLACPEDGRRFRGSLVEWRDESGNALGESDLAHAERFECITESNTFVLDILRDVEAGNSRHALVAVGKFARGSGLDFVIPERKFTWNPSETANKCVDSAKIGNLATFRLENDRRSGVHVSSSFMGLVNSFGRLYECPECAYDYEAYVSGLVFAPNFSPSERDEADRRLGLMASVGVSTAAESYSPTLTHAFTAAIKSMFDGAGFYAAALAFWCDGGRNAAGKAVVWLVEPVNSGCTLFPLFRKTLNNPVFLKKFFMLVKEYAEKSDSVAKMRAASKFAVSGDALSDSDRRRALSVLDVLVAENEQVEKSETTKRRGNRPPVRHVADGYTIEEREFDRVVVDALLNFEPEIDVTKFAAEYGWDHDRISDLYFDVLWNNPQVFYVTKQAQCRWSHCGEIITRFAITGIRYGISKEDYPARKAELDGAVAEALKSVVGIDDPVEKAKRLHDHIVRTCEYDRAAADAHDGSPLARTVYSVLVRHLAVCEGYTMAYRYLLREAGMRSEEVISDKMNHCWNYVQIGGSWYHVDVTWDDPVYAGKDPATAPILYDHFLLSDDALIVRKHHDWDVRGLPAATDTTYDARSWS